MLFRLYTLIIILEIGFTDRENSRQYFDMNICITYVREFSDLSILTCEFLLKDHFSWELVDSLVSLAGLREQGTLPRQITSPPPDQD